MRPTKLPNFLLALGMLALWAAAAFDLPGGFAAALAIVGGMALISAHAVRTESDIAPWTVGATALSASLVALAGLSV